MASNSDSDDDYVDGGSAHDIFRGKNRTSTGYTYDDLILLPGQITFNVADVGLETKLTKVSCNALRQGHAVLLGL